MIDVKQTRNMIFEEMNEENQTYWFDMKQKKFLHNIDTFYYSVKLYNDFTKDSEDENVLKFRNYFERKYNRASNFDCNVPLEFKGCNEPLLLRSMTFSRFYKISIECPDLYDIFIAPVVPTEETVEIIVQIRSYALWLYGVHASFEKSYEIIKAICKQFHLDIAFAQENRIDYCWHTNYFTNPENFFRIDNFMQMEVSRYKRVRQEYAKRGNKGNYELDYVALGKRSDKCFVRIYLKSKEVVEQGYKPFFFKIWLFNGLINRYDNYCLEEAFKQGNWQYLDVARLKFYVEFGSNEYYKNECSELLNKTYYDYDAIEKLANQLTPKVTKIINVEYQTMRRHTKTYPDLHLRDNSSKGECKRIYDFLDMRKLIIGYLTHDVLRLVEPNGDSNKSRRDYCPFWKALRQTKIVDTKMTQHNIKFIRQYNTKLDKEVLKKRLLNMTVTYGFYTKGLNNDDVIKDCADAILRLNDNDIHNMRQYKKKKSRQFNGDELAAIADNDCRHFQIIDEDGVLYDYDNISDAFCKEN